MGLWVGGPGDEPSEICTVLADDPGDPRGVTDLALSAVAGDRGCCAADESGLNPLARFPSKRACVRWVGLGAGDGGRGTAR
jgi:hypothetical protein